jgi:hypothetical protein
MEKDWSARFENSNPKNWSQALYACFVILLVLLFLLCTGWAFLGFATGFHDSTGRPRNSDLRGHIRVYTVALTPLIVTIAIAYAGWRRSKTVRNRRAKESQLKG